MNALPIKDHQPLGDMIDDLIASFGFRRVLLAVTARLFRKQHPPDTLTANRLAKEPSADGLSDHLRKDLGLPPVLDHTRHIDLLMLHRH